MNHLAVVEEGSDREPMGFNCGPSDLGKANWIAQELRTSLKGTMRVCGPEMQSSWFVFPIIFSIQFYDFT